VEFLRGCADKANGRAAGLRLALVTREKGDANAAAVAGLIGVLTGAGGAVAQLPSDSVEGSPAATAWMEEVARAGVALVDGTRGMEAYFSVKDAAGVAQVAAAGALAARMTRNIFVPEMERVIEDNVATTNEAVAGVVNAGLDALDKYKVKVDTSNIEFLLRPVVQSGGAYNVHVQRGNVVSLATPFTPDTIMFSMAVRYRTHSAMLARTLFVDPSPSQRAVYNAVLDAQEELIAGLRPGAVIGEVVARVRDAMLAKPALQVDAKRTKTFGCGFGLRPSDRYLALTAENETVVTPGMVFVVSIGLSAIPLTDAEGGTGMSKLESYAVLLADTVVVGADANDVVTSKMTRDRAQVSYETTGDGEEEEDAAAAAAAARAAAAAAGATTRSPRPAGKRTGTEADDEKKRAREEHQRLLAEKQKEEARRRLRGGGAAGGAGAEEADAAAGEIAAYAAASEYPKAGRQCQITIDKAHDAVLLPMFGTLVPFHVSTIKSVVKADEGPKTFLRLNFFAPGQAVGKDAAPAMAAAVAAHGDAIFVRTLNFMSRDGRNMSNVVNLIKVMQKKLKTDRDEEKLLADLKEQPKLVIVPGASVPQLRDLSMYPPISGRKTRGVLRAHSNGVRLTSDKGETVDLIYANVRHAVFQPCEREHVVLIHFHLKAPILINKKKVKDVQFFTEVVEQSQAIDGRHGSEFDADEMAEEERERRVRYELNKGFRSFMEAVHRISALPFETTTSSLMFTGAPLREMVNIMLCQECLVAVVDRPPFVVSVKDMEHVCFERVSVAYHTKTFDMVIIFKAGTRDKGEDEFVRITSIPIAALDLIKGWLDETAEVTFTELPQPMNWKLVIEGTVRKPDFYLSEGEDGEPKLSGWIQLLEDVGDGDDEEEDEEEESEYGGSSDEEEEESEEEEEDDDEFDDNVTDDDVRMRMCLCVWDAACLSLTDAPHPAHPINCRMMSMTTARTTTATRRTGTSWTDAPRRMTASASGKKTRRTRRSGPSATSMPSGRGIRAVRGARAWLGAGCGSCVRGHTIVIIGVPVLVAAVPQCGVCLQF